MKHIYLLFLLLSCQFVVAFGQDIDSIFFQKIKSDQIIDSTKNQRFDYHFFMAERYKNILQYDLAIEEYEQCLSIDSANAATWFELSKVHQFLDMPEKAYSLLQKAVGYDKKNLYYREIQAAYCTTKKEYDKAIKIFEKLLSSNKNKISYYYSLLDLYEATGKDKKYLNTIKKIETQQGISVETVMAKMEFYHRHNQVSKAIEEVNILTNKFPYNYQYKTIEGEYYLSIGDTAKAIASLKNLIKQNPTSGYAYMVLIDYYKSKNDYKGVDTCISKITNDLDIDIIEKIPLYKEYVKQLNIDRKRDEIETFFRTLIEKYSKESAAYSLFAAYLMEQKELSEAEDKLNTAISLNPDDINNWKMLAQVQITTDSISKLLKISDEAEKLFPEETTWSYYKVIGLIQQNKNKEAIELIDHYIKSVSDKERAFKSLILNLKADFLMQDSLYAEAFECYEKSIEYGPSNLLALNNYAYFLSECNLELDKAEKMSGKTIQIEPQNSTYLDTYAWILFKQKNLRDAKFYMERALLYGSSPELLEHYGDILFEAGDRDQAIEQWEKAKKEGNTSLVLQKKIDSKSYIEQTLKCK